MIKKVKKYQYQAFLMRQQRDFGYTMFKIEVMKFLNHDLTKITFYGFSSDLDDVQRHTKACWPPLTQFRS